MTWRRGRRILLTLAGLTAIAAGFGYVWLDRLLRLDLPSYPPPARTIWLAQNWSEAQRTWFHHASQGTLTFFMPYEWFRALEVPRLSLGDAGPFSGRDFLDRFGFIPDEAGQGLPVGFAIGKPFVDPVTGRGWTNPATGAPLTGIGFTCAACHTGRMTYKGTALLIDGGPALTNIQEFQKALGLAVLMTRYDPLRFGRFAERLLGSGASAEARERLERELDQVLGGLKAIQKLDDKVKHASVPEGFARLDALNRIGNQVFALDGNASEDYAPTSAPVNYPHIWGASWFDWVQYNGSIEQPMVRNAGEALGVRALVNLGRNGQPRFASTADIRELHAIERQLAGEQPSAEAGITGLRAPVWPEDVLPKIDRERAARGGVLYRDLCQGCHLPPVGSAGYWDPALWSAPNTAGQRYLRLHLVPIDRVGTDPAQAADMASRWIGSAPALGLGAGFFGPALGELVEKVVVAWYDAEKVPQGERERMNGNRPNGIRAPLAYKARPLDGIWATAPYLHNGAVPTLDALLSPVSERPTAFVLGNREFDPERVGYATGDLPGGSLLDTARRGNWNAGHAFEADPAAAPDTYPPGVIGRRLDKQERRDLIEYLKTL